MVFLLCHTHDTFSGTPDPPTPPHPSKGQTSNSSPAPLSGWEPQITAQSAPLESLHADPAPRTPASAQTLAGTVVDTRNTPLRGALVYPLAAESDFDFVAGCLDAWLEDSVDAVAALTRLGKIGPGTATDGLGRFDTHPAAALIVATPDGTTSLFPVPQGRSRDVLVIAPDAYRASCSIIDTSRMWTSVQLLWPGGRSQGSIDPTGLAQFKSIPAARCTLVAIAETPPAVLVSSLDLTRGHAWVNVNHLEARELTNPGPSNATIGFRSESKTWTPIRDIEAGRSVMCIGSNLEMQTRSRTGFAISDTK